MCKEGITVCIRIGCPVAIALSIMERRDFAIEVTPGWLTAHSLNERKIERLQAYAELRKARAIDSLYRTGRLDGKYFGKVQKTKVNSIKNYIASCMYKHRILMEESIIDDVYNEAFRFVQEIPAPKFCTYLDKGESFIISVVLNTISMRCFAVDNRRGNPKHSFIQNLLFSSSVKGYAEVDKESGKLRQASSNACIDSVEFYDEDMKEGALEQLKHNAENSIVILVSDEEPEDFVSSYGFSPEDIISRLNPEERAFFYSQIERQPRGKKSAINIEKSEALSRRIRDIKSELQSKGVERYE